MGFNTELQVVYPDYEVLGKGKTLWLAEEVIYLHNLTRLQKITDDIRNPGPHTRMGICLMSVIYGRLAEKLGRGVTFADFAPPFLIYESPEEQFAAYDVAREADGSYLDCGTSYRGEDAWLLKVKNPPPQQRKIHNEWLLVGQDNLNAYIANHYNIFVDSLVMWEECSMVAEWLALAEIEYLQEWEELQKNPISLAKARGWREYLREVGKVGAKVIFLFPRF